MALLNIDRSMHVFNLKLFGCVFVELRVFKVGGVVLAGGPRLFGPHCTSKHPASAIRTAAYSAILAAVHSRFCRKSETLSNPR